MQCSLALPASIDMLALVLEHDLFAWLGKHTAQSALGGPIVTR
jgi:hypothetical protein